MNELTKEELGRFSEQLATRFLTEVEGYNILLPLNEVPLEVRVVPLPMAEDVSQLDESSVKDNEIYFYSPSLKQAVFHLLRHFRNCAVHKGRIKKVERKGKLFYYFEDSTKTYLSMRGYIAVEKWNSYIDLLYSCALKNRKRKLIKK